MKLMRGRDELAQKFTRMLEEKAEGVILWVRLAIKSFLHGLTNRDSIQLLEQRLENLPSGMNELYSTMLAGIWFIRDIYMHHSCWICHFGKNRADANDIHEILGLLQSLSDAQLLAQDVSAYRILSDHISFFLSPQFSTQVGYLLRLLSLRLV